VEIRVARSVSDRDQLHIFKVDGFRCRYTSEFLFFQPSCARCRRSIPTLALTIALLPVIERASEISETSPRHALNHAQQDAWIRQQSGDVVYAKLA
jgi:hypothetical protein